MESHRCDLTRAYSFPVCSLVSQLIRQAGAEPSNMLAECDDVSGNASAGGVLVEGEAGAVGSASGLAVAKARGSWCSLWAGTTASGLFGLRLGKTQRAAASCIISGRSSSVLLVARGGRSRRRRRSHPMDTCLTTSVCSRYDLEEFRGIALCIPERTMSCAEEVCLGC